MNSSYKYYALFSHGDKDPVLYFRTEKDISEVTKDDTIEILMEDNSWCGGDVPMSMLSLDIDHDKTTEVSKEEVETYMIVRELKK